MIWTATTCPRMCHTKSQCTLVELRWQWKWERLLPTWHFPQSICNQCRIGTVTGLTTETIGNVKFKFGQYVTNGRQNTNNKQDTLEHCPCLSSHWHRLMSSISISSATILADSSEYLNCFYAFFDNKSKQFTKFKPYLFFGKCPRLQNKPQSQAHTVGTLAGYDYTQMAAISMLIPRGR
jgi:hypothetical protein